MEIKDRGILLEHARSIRDLTMTVASRFTADEAFRVPPFCNNCPIWNIGHVMVVQENLILRPFGERGALPAPFGELFGEGWCACDWNGNRPDWDEVVGLLAPTRERVEEFIRSGPALKTALPEPYLTATGIALETLADALSFCTLHEAIHLGVLTTYSRLLVKRPMDGIDSP